MRVAAPGGANDVTATWAGAPVPFTARCVCRPASKNPSPALRVTVVQPRSPDSRVAVRLMLALEASGNVPGALAHARVHETMLREELGIGLDPAVAELVERLRANQIAPRTRLLSTTSAVAPETPSEPASAAAVAHETVQRKAGAVWRRSRWAAGLGVVVVGLAVGFVR